MDIELSVEIQNRLKAIMADRGFRNMQVLAEESGLSRNMLYMFERGETSLSLKNLVKIMWVLDCSFDELIQYSVQSNEPNDFESLSDDVQAQLTTHDQKYKARRKYYSGPDTLKKKRA